jgi:alkylhydroperoxidase family enzyme
MSRIPSHTIDDAPAASRSLLQNAVQFSPTGRPLNLHAQMAHSPAVLVAYTALRKATAEYGTLGPQLSAALMLATATTVGNDYVVRITSRLARIGGWAAEQVGALQGRAPVGDNKIDALIGLVREAAANSGHVTDSTWNHAQDAGWGDEQLAEAFAYLGLTVFTAYFLNYAGTDIDV